MQRFDTDLHIHSLHSISVSKSMTIPMLAKGAKEKGLHLIGTGDVTQPDWLEHLKKHLIDDDGVEHKCRIYEGKGSLPGQEYLNKRLEFSIGSYQGTYQGQPYTSYSGFWSHGAVNAPQNQQQAPRQGTPATNYQRPVPQGKKEPNWDAIAKGKVRCAVLCGMLQGGIQVDYTEVLVYTRFIMTGIDPNIPDPHPDIQESPDNGQAREQVPETGFCSKCGQPRSAHCTCDDVPF